MGIINNITAPFRSIAEYLASQSNYKNSIHLLDNTNIVASNNINFADEESSPSVVYELVTRDTMFSALVEYVVRETIKQGFFITPRKNSNGDYLFSPRGADVLTSRLQDSDFIKMVSKLIAAEIGEGGGNVLLYTVKRGRKLELVSQPFWELSRKRIEIKADMDTSTILEYVVRRYDSTQAFVSLDPTRQFAYQTRYSEVGDFRFSSNPAKKAAYWYELKKNIAGANLSIFKNGIQGNLVMTPDYDQIAKLIQAASSQTIPRIGNEGMEFITDPLGYFGKAQKLDVEILRKDIGNPKHTNRLIKMLTPHVFKDVTKTNVDMNTMELIAECDKQMAYGIMLSLSLLDSRQAKYSNAEVDQDNAKNSVIDFYKAKIEWIAENKILPVTLAGWDKTKYRFRLGRDADAEDLEQFQQKTGRNTSVAGIISVLATVPGYKYNLETHEIEEVIKSADSEVVNEKQTVDEIVLEQRVLDIDEVFARYHEAVNMSAGELTAWSETECSKKASLDSSPVTRNLELLNTEKSKWTSKHVKWANRTISFVARMKANLGGKNIVKDKNGEEYGTKAYISLKNWAYDTEKGSARSAKDLTPSERAIESMDYKRTLNVLEKAIVKQINTYTGSIKTLADFQTVAFPAIPLTVSVMKQQLTKFANQGYEEFLETTRLTRALPESAENYIDAKAQLLLKGWDSLSSDQRELIANLTSGEFIGYKGVDKTTSARVLTVINKGVKDGLMLEQILINITATAPIIAKSRATTILNTEVPQAVEATRYLVYTGAGFDEKRWLTVRDNNVRDGHTDNELDGWIKVSESFDNKAMSPAQEINCRCTLVFRMSNLDNL